MKLLIVNFHYFREQKYRAGIYPVNKKQLSTQLDILHRYFKFIDQATLLEYLSSPPDRGNYCLITFDDGLKEQMRAFELLQSKGIPSMFFVCTAPYLTTSPLRVHQLHYLRSQVSDDIIYEWLDDSYGIDSYDFDKDILSNQYRYDQPRARRIKYFLNFILSLEQRESFIERAFGDLVNNPKWFTKELYMSQLDLQKLTMHDCLGSHGTNHRPMGNQVSSEAREDVENSLDYLKRLTNKAVKGYSYPYGGKEAVIRGNHKNFCHTSIEYAMTMWRGFNRLKELKPHQKYYLHRIDCNDAPGGKLGRNDFIP